MLGVWLHSGYHSDAVLGEYKKPFMVLETEVQNSYSFNYCVLNELKLCTVMVQQLRGTTKTYIYTDLCKIKSDQRKKYVNILQFHFNIFPLNILR